LLRVAALVALVALAACSGEEALEVQTEPVTAGEVTQTVSAPAAVAAAARQDVAASVSGVVLELRVSDGERVRKGQEILRLTSAQVDLAREQAAAAEAAANGVGGVAVDGNGDQTLAAAQQAVANLDATTKPQLQQARQRARRIDDREQRQAALAAVDAVEASYASTRAALLAAGRTVATQQDTTAASLSRALQNAVAAATAPQRLQAQSAARLAEDRAKGLVVAAPFAGVIQLSDAAASDGTAVPAEIPPELEGLAGSFGALAGGDGGGTLRVGAPVAAGQTLFTVFDLSNVYVTAEVDEVDAPQVKVGQRARVLVDAFPEALFEGVVERIAVEAEQTSAGGVGYPAHIRLIGAAVDRDAPPLRRLRIGMTSSADIVTRTRDSDLVVPSRALLRRDDADVVFVLRNDYAEMIEVDVLALGEDQAAVRGDLSGDDEVIVSGYEDLADGDEVATD
jgi:HlyD family secretion protein